MDAEVVSDIKNMAMQGEESPADSFLFIGELAKRTGVDPKTIRFYERAELLSPPRHGRFRTYLASDVRRLQNVLNLRKLGIPIAQIRELLETVGDKPDILSHDAAADMLRSHLDLLRSKQSELTKQIEQTAIALQRSVA
ncbi:MAG: MerR family transcriptional regulator [Alphaproteobacteria bacterium]|nr:MerR family transcriptional regulator [Alphaproteobacteria bacterium]